MRLSEIKGERVLDVIAEIAEPLFNIALDEEAMEFFKREKPPEGADPTRFVLERWKRAVPRLVGGHKDDLVAVMAAIGGVSRDEYLDGLTMASLVKDLYEMVTDEDLLAFLS